MDAARNICARRELEFWDIAGGGFCEEDHLRRVSLAIGLIASVAASGLAAAQSPDGRSPQPPSVACPPDVKGAPPTVGGPSTPDLSDRLAESKGVICPPANVDPEMRKTPPGGGELKVIPPPGSPGGNPNVEPK